LTPWDFWIAAIIARYREHMARLLPVWLNSFHNLEALISLGAFTAQNPDYTFPEICVEAQPVFEAQGLGHPLLPYERKICNDFHLATLGELSIITGSNMAGKSTFIRTIGVNLCLAYAGGPVNATFWRSLPFRLYTCIRISDSLGDGFSYFYAEVKRLKGLLEAISPDGYSNNRVQSQPLLYLIDEIFRGTNNRERMIGSRAYVKALIGAKGIGVIATHDLELVHLAEIYSQVLNFHFRDEVQEGKLVFDYLIRPGPSPTTNALKIMQIEGLPVS
jgi:DNA mismatch repair ATPase MutS